ncbi:hypothetical protein RSOLAG1IB_08343 [Rhizoctonia solani AG-1 IB]|uniref:Uncharacterized protein n=1 Tax=Thanatephorus cucumeris (strain AG1-IB / isolate 7/3/14) TaxID=1108050 RepID=A0A0B7FGK6_THACB|nr:hypothetical protein RSOLAG1IB_08343 [Rhizoctonia solani AG-1 IB]
MDRESFTFHPPLSNQGGGPLYHSRHIIATLPIPSTDKFPDILADNMRPSEQNVSVNTGRRRRSTLEGSLTGVLRPRCYTLTNGYPTHEGHENKDIRDMVIKPDSIDTDMRLLRSWIHSLNSDVDLWESCDKPGYKRADSARIVKILKITQGQPTFIYISGHSEHGATDSELVYAPADYLSFTSGQPTVVHYAKMAQLLLRRSHSGPLLLVTEVCFCENFLKLPYFLNYKDGEVSWERTGCLDSFAEDSRAIVHFAATAPGERAMSFSNGAVFTKQFCKIRPDNKLSLKDIAKQLHEEIDRALDKCGIEKEKKQHPRIYCSRKLDGPHFYDEIGLCSSPETDSILGDDCDSNA